MTVEAFNRNKNGSGGTEPHMSEDRIEEIRLRLRRLKDSEGLTDNAIGKKIGKAGSTVGLFLNAKYPGEETKIAEAAESYLDLVDQQKAIGTGPSFVSTSISKRIERAMFVAEAASKIAVIATQSGLGKTRTIFDWRLKHPKALYVPCSPTLNEKWSLLGELLYVLTKDERKRRNPTRELVEGLQGSTRAIVIDEAQFLPQDCLEMLRCIQEQAGVALILSGNETIYERGPGRIGGAAAHVQFTSRVVAWLHLGVSDIKSDDVRMVAQQMVSAGVVEDAFGLLQHETIATTGGFRRLVAICQLAQMLAGSRTVTKTHIVRAIAELKQLGGGEE